MSAPRLPLLLLPGMLNDHTLWARVLPELEPLAECRIVEWDLEDTVGAMADRVLAMAGEGDFAVAGFSMGGFVAQELVARCPARVARLALIATSAGPAEEKRRAVIARTAEAAQADFEGVLTKMLPGSVDASRLDDESLVGPMVAMWRRVGPERFAGQCRAVAGRPDRRDALAGYGRPAAIIAGRTDAVCPPVMTAGMEALLHRSAVWIDACGHMSPLEQPQSVARAMRQWLKEV